MKELKMETIKKLEEVKNNLVNQDNESNYCDMIDTMIDYDNEAQDDLYLSDTCRELVDIVNEETLQYYVEYQLKEFGMCRVPYMFRGIDFEDTVYKCNTYGNLENVTNDDFKYCIDEIIEILKDSLESEKH